MLGLDRGARAGSGRPHAARSTDARSTDRPRAPARPATTPLTAPPRAPNRPPAARSRSAGQGARYYPFRGLPSQPPRSTDPALLPLDRPLHGRDRTPSPSPSPRGGMRDLSCGNDGEIHLDGAVDDGLARGTVDASTTGPKGMLRATR